MRYIIFILMFIPTLVFAANTRALPMLCVDKAEADEITKGAEIKYVGESEVNGKPTFFLFEKNSGVYFFIMVMDGEICFIDGGFAVENKIGM